MDERGPLAQLQAASFERANSATRVGYPKGKRMSGQELEQFVLDIAYLTIATVRSNGRPHAAMSTFVVHKGSAWIPTESGTLRLRNLATKPFAALVIAEGSDEDHRIVLTEGETRSASNSEVAPEVVEAWRAKYEEADGPGWADSWVEVRLTKLFSYRARD